MRPEKTAMLEEAKSMIDESAFMLLVDYSGLDVEKISDLRSKLRETGAEIHVTKNRLLKIVADGQDWDGIEDILQGPTATIVGEDELAAARVLKEFAKEYNIPTIKAGVIDGEVLGAADVKALADLPSKDTLRSMLVGTLAAPMSQLVGVMNQKLASIVYVLQAAEQKKA